jgi:uncharacterized membrane protein HdeD (DUF308 family)
MNDIKSEIKSSASSMKWMGMLTIIFGILAMMMPYITGQSVLMLIGIMVMAGGIIRMIWAFKAGSLGKGILVFIIGGLTLLAGFWIITEPFIAAGALTIVLSIYFFMDGFAEIMAAFSLTEGKGWLIFDGVVTVILGILLFLGFPFSGPLAVGVLLGIKLLLAGITMLTLGSAVKQAV